MTEWSAAFSALIRSGTPIERSVKLEVRNGYRADVGGDWTEIPLYARGGWFVTKKDANPVITTARFRVVMKNFEYLDEFDHNNPVQQDAACRLSLIVDVSGAPETEYLWRGVIRTKQEQDLGLLVECEDPLGRMQRKLSPLNLEADIDGGHANAELDHALNWDTAATFFTYELDRVLANNWGFVNDNITDKRRRWVAGIFTVEEETAPAVWEPISVSEYIIDEVNGLVRFHNDQGAGAVFRLVLVSVYLEGTLELAYVIEKMLEQTASWDPGCADLGCGFTTAQMRTALTGTFTLTNGSTALVGVGTDFVNELSQGERVAHTATPDDYGIVESVTDANNAVLRYVYRGGTAGPLAGYKSNLRASGVSLSNINWRACDGTAADLYRKLQQYYADTRGYKLWWDHENDVVRGDRVAIDYAAAMRLGPVRSLPVRSTLEDLSTAVSVSGIIGRAKNLMTEAGVTVTLLILLLPGWNLGLSRLPSGSWNGITLDLIEPPASDAVNDTDLTHCLCAYIQGGAAVQSNWYDFYRVDLGGVWEISEIHYYNIPSKNPNNFTQGVSLLGSLNVGGPWVPITPETYRTELEANEHRVFDCTNSAPVRYILVQGRPFKWVTSSNSRTLGVREMIVFGTEQICTTACIQDTVPAGPAPHTEGTGGHFIGGSGDEDDWIQDYYLDLCTKLTNSGHRTLLDDQGLVYTEMQALDRAYLLLDEVIRMYRAVRFRGLFDPRFAIFDTALVSNEYRPTSAEDLYFLVQHVEISETGTLIGGTEYGAGPLE